MSSEGVVTCCNHRNAESHVVFTCFIFNISPLAGERQFFCRPNLIGLDWRCSPTPSFGNIGATTFQLPNSQVISTNHNKHCLNKLSKIKHFNHFTVMKLYKDHQRSLDLVVLKPSRTLEIAPKEKARVQRDRDLLVGQLMAGEFRGTQQSVDGLLLRWENMFRKKNPHMGEASKHLHISTSSNGYHVLVALINNILNLVDVKCGILDLDSSFQPLDHWTTSLQENT